MVAEQHIFLHNLFMNPCLSIGHFQRAVPLHPLRPLLPPDAEHPSVSPSRHLASYELSKSDNSNIENVAGTLCVNGGGSQEKKAVNEERANWPFLLFSFIIQ